MRKLTVTLSFDDGRLDTYTNAYRIMKKYNLYGTIHVITGYVDGSFTRQLSGSDNALTIENLIEMENTGWEISSHGDQHITEKKDFLQSIEKLKKWGFTDGEIGFSIPNSKIVYEKEEDFVSFLQENKIPYMRGGRGKKCYKLTSKIWYVLYHVFHSRVCYRLFYRHCFMNHQNVDQYNLVTNVIRKEDKEDYIIDLLKHHVGKQEWVIFMLHSIGEGDSPWCWSEQRFTVFCENLRKLVDDGKIEVRTIMDVVKEIE